MLFMFSCLDERVDISCLPKFNIIINNVSKHGDVVDIDALEKDLKNAIRNKSVAEFNENRIEDIKSQLKESAKVFYIGAYVSDRTQVGKKTWMHIKKEVCQGESFKGETWFKELTDHEKLLISDLRQM